MLIRLLVLILTFGNFTGAADIDYDVAGNVYVVDRSSNTLEKLSPNGDSIRAVSGLGSGDLQFDSPVAVCARAGNDIYVADYNNHRIQRFNRMLDYITTIYTRDDPDERKRFGYPRDVAVTRQGDLVIVDGENRRIIKFDSFGNVMRDFGNSNAGAGRLTDPSNVEVDAEDNVYVLDGGRILMFDPFGSFVRNIPSAVAGQEVRSISIDRDTLTVLGTEAVALIDLRTTSNAGYYGLARRATALRLIGGDLVGVEAGHGVIYAIPRNEEPER